MTYMYEQLGDERFQRLCQAILVARHPDVQSLPVGQPDGGRDAMRRHSGSAAPEIVYQVKFSRNPSSKDDRRAIEDLIKGEKAKVSFLVSQGMKSYYLLTNIAGTSHPDMGSIDKVNKMLTEEFGVPSFCYWRDDLDAAIAANGSIRWAFPEILRATDIIENLIIAAGGSENSRRAAALKAYLAHQYEYDSRLKFKQIDLQKGLTDLFVDVPIRLLSELDRRLIEPLRTAKSENFAISLLSASFDEGIYSHDESKDKVKAAFILSDPVVRSTCRRIVLEGAPGQGKSTVTQFLCQASRIRLLGKEIEAQSLPRSIRGSPVAFPFRVDLRDYATWLSGRDPFTTVSGVPTHRDGPNQLESFLARQVASCSGGTAFTADDLLATLRGSSVLIVLDGFDEVADVESRKSIVRQVREAAVRIEANAESSFIIVTSRPSAFANSPGFPKHEWHHLGLIDLDQNTIFAYADKWSDANALEPIDKADLFSTLKEKLALPHVRDLARNPMQLAILLNLINSQGASLPNKRTTLYDRYVDTFLDREAEKSEIVRDHRDILLDLHRHLAWILQSEVEINKEAGNIAEGRLKIEVSNYLSSVGHNPLLAEKLFSGMVERVVALVSRVQGTYEFEVQPLREYFAARHLHETVPYIQAGSSKRGSIMDRFDALARNRYWHNVTRFYCGCYSTGELSSLVDGLDIINTTKPYRATNYAASLSVVLLADYVFTLQPRLINKLLNYTVITSRFEVFLASVYEYRGRDAISLPENNGREHLVNHAINTLKEECQFDRSFALCRILKSCIGDFETSNAWKTISSSMDSKRYIRDSYYSTAIYNISNSELIDHADLTHRATIRFIFNANRFDIFDSSPFSWRIMANMVLDDTLSGYKENFSVMEIHEHTDFAIRILADVLKTISRGIDHLGGHDNIWQRINQYRDGAPNIREIDARWTDKVPFSETLFNLSMECAEICDILDENSFSLISRLVETAYAELGPRHLIISAALTLANNNSTPYSLTYDQSSIIESTREVLQNVDVSPFWRSNLTSSTSQNDLLFYIQTFLLFASGDGFHESFIEFEDAVKRLSPDEFISICDIIEELEAPYSDNHISIDTRLYSSNVENIEFPQAISLLVRCFPHDQSKNLFLKLVNLDSFENHGVADIVSTLAWHHIIHGTCDIDICISALERSYITGAVPTFYYEDEEPSLSIIASEKLLNRSSYIPLMCIDRASNAVIQGAGEKTVPVARVAESQNWFS